MKQRFTIIQGGRTDIAPAPGGDGLQMASWRVVLRRPIHLDEEETAAWRALCGRTAPADPFADPDFLIPAAQHAPRIDGGVVFALAYAVSGGGEERLGGVLPLKLPHPLWGGHAIGLWQPALAPHLVEPVFDRGTAPAVVAAVLRHLRSVRPGTELRIDAGDAAEGASRYARFGAPRGARAAAIPQAQFVAVGGAARDERIERATAPEAVRAAVERFLLVDARHARASILSDPAASATLRVVTRLLARRGLAEVELGYRDGEPVSGTIRLGAAGRRLVWRALGDEADAQPDPGRVSENVGTAGACRGTPPVRLRLVASKG